MTEAGPSDAQRRRIYERLVTGLLREHNLSRADVLTYQNCGGRHRQLRAGNTYVESVDPYFHHAFGSNARAPPFKEICPCGQKLVNRNSFICNAQGELDSLVVIGSCCIKYFDNCTHRTCAECNARHTNIHELLCNECRALARMPECEACGVPHRNRADNFCNACRAKRKRCLKCDVRLRSVELDARMCGRCARLEVDGHPCGKCGTPHLNLQRRIPVNRCNACRAGRCDKCGHKCDRFLPLCPRCLRA